MLVLAIGIASAAATDVPAEPATLTVLAAASLTESFRAIAAAFEAARPGTHVTLAFAGSQTLAQQIRQGAPGDVFAAADEPTMQGLIDAGAIDGTPAVFAENALAIVVPPGNPKGVHGLVDLARPGLVLVLAGPTVPAGRYAAQAFAKAGVAVPAGASQEADVKAVVTKVGLGEADAGVAYVTDVTAAGDRVVGVDIPAAENVVARYPIAVVKESRQRDAARAFVAFVLGPEGRRALERAGFHVP